MQWARLKKTSVEKRGTPKMQAARLKRPTVKEEAVKKTPDEKEAPLNHKSLG
jgi:hypothetical protein